MWGFFFEFHLHWLQHLLNPTFNLLLILICYQEKETVCFLRFGFKNVCEHETTTSSANGNSSQVSTEAPFSLVKM